MNLRDAIALRNRLREDLETVEKFIAVARRYDEPQKPHTNGTNGSDASVEPQQKCSDPNQKLMPIVAKGYGEIGSQVIHAIKACSGSTFTINDVEAALRSEEKPLRKLQIST